MDDAHVNHFPLLTVYECGCNDIVGLDGMFKMFVKCQQHQGPNDVPHVQDDDPKDGASLVCTEDTHSASNQTLPGTERDCS